MVQTPRDNAQRLRALDPSTSFICEAPAGSGKTELLVQRFLTLLGNAEQPEELLAITFTRKATAEMRARVLAALADAAATPRPGDAYRVTTWTAARRVLETDRLRNWNLMQNPNRLQIRTFDSLCTHLAGALPFHSTFGAIPALTDRPQDLYRDAIRQLFEDLEQDTGWTTDLAVVMKHLDNNFQTMESLFHRMLQRRDEWLPLLDRDDSMEAIRQRLETHLQHVFDDAVARLEQALPRELHDELISIAARAAENLAAEGRESPVMACRYADTLPDSSETGIRCWQGLAELLLTRQGTWRKTLSVSTGFPPGKTREEKSECSAFKQRMTDVIGQLSGLEDLAGLFHDMRNLPTHNYTAGQMSVLHALVRLLPVLAARLLLVFSEANTVDYTEMAIRAQRALGKLDTPSDLAMYLDYRIRHILVDEFQDVSASQVGLLQLLTAGWQPGDGHTLFCVGDAMQSIYGFRNSNVGLFIRCLEHGLADVPLEPVRLTTNFRTHDGMVDWINSVFRHAFPGRNDVSRGAVAYSPSDAFHASDIDRPVVVHGIEAENYGDAEAHAVAKLVSRYRETEPASSIAILVRSRSHATGITYRLKSTGIRYQAVDLEPLSGNALIGDLMSLCRAMLHPADRIAWLSVLRAPWCGLSLHDLHAVANTGAGSGGGRPLTVQEQARACLARGSAAGTLSAEGRSSLLRVLDVLDCAGASRQRKPLRQWIEGTWLALGGPACLRDRVDLENAERFFSVLESPDIDPVLPEITALVDAAAALFAAPDPASDGSLQVMTIHKAKGLEFDIVIIPGLHRRPRSNPPELLSWQDRLTADGRREVILAPIPARDSDVDQTYTYLQSEQRYRDSHETCRLMYVACTRARQRLHLFTAVATDDQQPDGLKPPPVSSLLSPIWPQVSSHVEYNRPAANPAPANPDNAAMGLWYLPGNWQFPKREWRNLLAAFTVPGNRRTEVADEFDTEQGDVPLDELLRETNPLARHAGTVIHQGLQQIVRQGPRHWDVTRLKSMRAFYRARLATLGVTDIQLDAAVERVIGVLAQVLDDPLFHWINDGTHVFRYCEYPVTLATSSGFANLVIDLYLQDAGGRTWVIDYKTGGPADGQTRADFIAANMQLYRMPMQRYRDAVMMMGHAEVRAALYFPALGEMSEY